MVLETLVLIASPLIGGVLPFGAGASHRRLHRFVAFAAGSFLGTVFLHLLPEALAPDVPRLDIELLGALTLAGVLTLYVIENVALPGKESSDRHVVVGWGSFVGLGLHAFAAGIGLATTGDDTALSTALLVSLAAHKMAEGFSLTTMFRLSGAPVARIVAVLAAFSLATPIGRVVGGTLLANVAAPGAQAITAAAAGTFLYVSLCDLLPEVFHGREDALPRLLALAIGIATSAGLHEFGG